jgi:stress response protein YsnF
MSGEEGIIRSEQELVATTETVHTGRARLVKRVEVDTITRTIEVRREILAIEHLDADAPDAGPSPTGTSEGQPQLYEIHAGPLAPGSFEEGIVEIVLMQEEVELTTRAVPRERVRLNKQVITENRIVDADLLKERVELDQQPSAGESR